MKSFNFTRSELFFTKIQDGRAKLNAEVKYKDETFSQPCV